MAKQPIILSEEIIPPPALVRAGLESLPAIIRAQGDRAARRFIEFFTATIPNRTTRMAYARAVKRFFDWCDEHHLMLEDIEPIAISAYIEELRAEIARRASNNTWVTSSRFSNCFQYQALQSYDKARIVP